MWRSSPIRLVVLALVCLSLSACGGSKKISDEDFKKAKSNMSETDVVAALGKPSETSEADSALGKMKIMIWQGEGDKGYMVSFLDGKAMMTMSSDMKTIKAKGK